MDARVGGGGVELLPPPLPPQEISRIDNEKMMRAHEVRDRLEEESGIGNSPWDLGRAQKISML